MAGAFVKGLRIHIVNGVLVMCVCDKPVPCVCEVVARLALHLGVCRGFAVSVVYLVLRFGSVRGMLSQPLQICIHALV